MPNNEIKPSTKTHIISTCEALNPKSESTIVIGTSLNKRAEGECLNFSTSEACERINSFN